MEEKNGVPCVTASTPAAWRRWLQRNHDKARGVWLIIYKKESSRKSVYYPEAVDEALCFGWVDSKGNRRDNESYYQYFAPRNPRSNWSRINREKVERLLREGKMTEAGLKMVNLAKERGTWQALDPVDALTIPDDLETELARYPNARAYWDAFPPSTRRGILEWILNAKRPETRTRRVLETAELASKNIRANQFAPKKS